MFNKTPAEKTGLEKTLDELFVQMANLDGADPQYAAMADQVLKLYALKEVDQKIDSGKHVSRETWAVIGANLAGIIMIVGHERAHVVTSKALSFIQKLR